MDLELPLPNIVIKEELDPFDITSNYLVKSSEFPLSNIVIKEELDLYDITSNLEQYFTCYHCDEEFINLGHLKTHIKRCHILPIDYLVINRNMLSKSSISHSSYLRKTKRLKKRKNAIKRGWRRKARERNAVLPECLRSARYYFTSSDLSTFNKLHCQLCQFQCKSASKMIEHMRLKHNREKVFDCPSCECSTTQFGDLRRHYISRHTNRKEYSCSYCSFSTSRSITLTRHLFAMHQVQIPLEGLKLAFCTHCSYRTARKDRLKEHILKFHPMLSGSRTSKANLRRDINVCPHCEFKTLYRSSFKRHLNAVHALVSQSSNKLDYSSDYYAELIQTQYTRSKSFICSHCGYKALYLKHLRNHIKEVHSKMLTFNQVPSS